MNDANEITGFGEREALSSRLGAVAEEAGLAYAGFGHWRDQFGRVTHVVEGKRLVTLFPTVLFEEHLSTHGCEPESIFSERIRDSVRYLTSRGYVSADEANGTHTRANFFQNQDGFVTHVVNRYGDILRLEAPQIFRGFRDDAHRSADYRKLSFSEMQTVNEYSLAHIPGTDCFRMREGLLTNLIKRRALVMRHMLTHCLGRGGITFVDKPVYPRGLASISEIPQAHHYGLKPGARDDLSNASGDPSVAAGHEPVAPLRAVEGAGAKWSWACQRRRFRAFDDHLRRLLIKPPAWTEKEKSRGTWAFGLLLLLCLGGLLEGLLLVAASALLLGSVAALVPRIAPPISKAAKNRLEARFMLGYGVVFAAYCVGLFAPMADMAWRAGYFVTATASFVLLGHLGSILRRTVEAIEAEEGLLPDTQFDEWLLNWEKANPTRSFEDMYDEFFAAFPVVQPSAYTPTSISCAKYKIHLAENTRIGAKVHRARNWHFEIKHLKRLLGIYKRDDVPASLKTHIATYELRDNLSAAPKAS